MADRAPTRDRRSVDGERWSRAAWVLLAVVTIWTCWGTLRHDYRDATLVGDQASQLMQTVSLAYGANLGYDESDLHHYADATWRVRYREPVGLLFQRDGSGWAAAKPYGYSLVAAPFLRLLGPTRGIAVVNTLLLLAVLAVVLALLRLCFRGPVVPATAGALVFASNVVPYSYVLYVELFTAMVVGVAAYGLLRGIRTLATHEASDDRATHTANDGVAAPSGETLGTVRRLWPLLLGFAALGMAVAEKGPLLIALGPLAVVALARQRGWAARLVPVAVALVVFGLAVLPYLAASDGHSYSPYGGERYGSPGGGVPFSEPPAAPTRYSPARTNETVSVSYVRSQLTSDWANKAHSAVTYVVGRHTGLLVFMPVAVVVIGLALSRGRKLDLAALSVLLGIVGYAAFYVALFSDNYYGGGQSFGNRYFVQICPLVAALAASARLPGRQLLAGVGAAIVVGSAVLWPNLTQPSTAVEHIERTSAVQRIFPFESNQAGAIRFACGVITPPGPRLKCNARYEADHPSK